MPTSFEILYEGNVWICDTGASSHLTNDASETKNVRNSGSPGIGHTSESVKAYKTIDLQGQFMAKDGTSGLKAKGELQPKAELQPSELMKNTMQWLEHYLQGCSQHQDCK